MNGHRYRMYLLVLLQVILAANYLDGLALGLTLQSIKTDLHLTDTQLGLLSGLAFAVFYSVMGIPIARWADRGNRAHIISLTAALWSLMVILCGLVTGFVELLAVRVGVGIGEAGCLPPAHSLIADYFDRAERPKAVSIYMLGTSTAVVVGYVLAGWLNEWYGWRVTFEVLGTIGLIPAALAAATLREPRRSAVAAAAHPSVRVVWKTLWANRTFRHLLYAFAVMYFFGNGVAQWQPAFFIRSYHVTTGQLGLWFALIYGVGGLLGTYAGGVIAARYAANNECGQLRGLAVLYSLYGLLSALVYVAPSLPWAFGLLGCASVVGSVAVGPLFSTIQTLIPERMRAMSIAIVYFFANLIGLGLGPLATGALSDQLRPFVGEDSLRDALLCLCPGYLWVSWHLARGSRTVMADILSQS